MARETYGALGDEIIGGSDGMVRGFSAAYPGHDFLISRESGDYQPEMEWLAGKLDALEGGSRRVLNPWLIEPHEIAGCDLYRFFELVDIANVEHGDLLLTMAHRGELNFTPPLKPFLDEKLWLALFWIPQLRHCGEQLLSTEHSRPAAASASAFPLPGAQLAALPLLHAEWPRLGIHTWEEMKKFGNKERRNPASIKTGGWSEKSWAAAA